MNTNKSRSRSASLERSSSASIDNVKKGFFDFLNIDNKKKKRRASVQLGMVGRNSEEAKKISSSRRLSLKGAASVVISSSKLSKSSKKNGNNSTLGRGNSFEIKPLRYNKREYEHHFVPLTVVVATWNVGGHICSYSDLKGLKAWLIDTLPKYPQQNIHASDDEPDETVNASRMSMDIGTENCPDLYVLGLQEIVAFNAKNVMLSNQESQNCSRQWLDIFQCILPRQHKYKIVTSKSMVGIFLCVFVKECKMKGISCVRSTSVGVGLMGTGGNKGTVAVSLCYGRTSLCLMTAHLAAHRENVEGRCSDYKNVMTRTNFNTTSSSSADSANTGMEWCVLRKCSLYVSLATKSKEVRQLQPGETLVEQQRAVKKDGGRLWIQFKDGWTPTKASSFPGAKKLIAPRSNSESNTKASSSQNSTGATSLLPSDPSVSSLSLSEEDDRIALRAGKPLEHDVLFFFGDLNFRLGKSIDLDSAYQCIACNDLDQLLEYDQLCELQQRGRLFSSWTEARIKFNPTFKYLEGENEYDRRPSGKLRVPAWCDRIMWQAPNSTSPRVVPHLYTHCLDPKASDHKPVVASFTVKAQRPVTYICEQVTDSSFKPPDDLNLTRLFAISGAIDEKQIQSVLSDAATVGTQYVPPEFYVEIEQEQQEQEQQISMQKLRTLIAAEDAKNRKAETSNGPSDCEKDIKAINDQDDILQANKDDNSSMIYRFKAVLDESYLQHVPWVDAEMPPVMEASDNSVENNGSTSDFRDGAGERARRASIAMGPSRAVGATVDSPWSSTAADRVLDSSQMENVATAQKDVMERLAAVKKRHDAEIAQLRTAHRGILMEKEAALNQLRSQLRVQRQQFQLQLQDSEREHKSLIDRIAQLKQSIQQQRPSVQKKESTTFNWEVALANAKARIQTLEGRLEERERVLVEAQREVRERIAEGARMSIQVKVMRSTFDDELTALRLQVSTLIEGFKDLIPAEVLSSILIQKSSDNHSQVSVNGNIFQSNNTDNKGKKNYISKYQPDDIANDAPFSSRPARIRSETRSSSSPRKSANKNIIQKSINSPIELGYSSSPKLPKVSTTWFYKTNIDADEYGPFSTDEMQYWYSNGSLPDSLLVRMDKSTHYDRLADLGGAAFES